MSAIRTCRPAVVILQEVFERSMASLIAGHLPECRVSHGSVTPARGAVSRKSMVSDHELLHHGVFAAGE